MKIASGAITGRIAVLAAMNGACATMPAGPMTAQPTPLPMLINVAGFAVARNTLPAASDEAATDPAPGNARQEALNARPVSNGFPCSP